MVPRRNYIVMTMLMFLTVFLFLFTGAAKEYFSQYEQNGYAVAKEELADSRDVFYPDISELTEGKECVIYVGDTDEDIYRTVRQWAIYSKRFVLCQSEIPSLSRLQAEDVEMMLVDGLKFSTDAQINALYETAEQGVSLVFLRLPDVSKIESSAALRELLGIQEVHARQTVLDGVVLLDGFLLGGGMEYPASGEAHEDMGAAVPWYCLASGTKMYIKGLQLKETEEYQPLVWYHSLGSSFVFCVNGDYLSGEEGIGILEGFAAENNDYDLYPVINAQNFLVLNYPTVAEENGGAMMEYYSQPLTTVEKEIVWTGLSSMASWVNGGLTCMFAPRLNYSSDLELDIGDTVYYMNLMRREQGEMGLSGVALFGTPLSEKVKEDESFLEEALPGYEFTSAYLPVAYVSDVETLLSSDPTEKLRTIATDYTGERPVVSYLSDEVTEQGILTDAASYSHSDDFRMRSIASGIGYTSLKMDMQNVAYPASQEDSWEVYYQNCSDHVADYYNCYTGFERTTVSEADERIRNFLALNYWDERQKNKIYVEVSGTDAESWFILRTHGERIEEVEGGSFEELEENAYLIEIDGQGAVIVLDDAETEYQFWEEAVR